jgi:hypothetical protein
MPLDNAWNAYIFRDGKTPFRGADLVNELAKRLLAFHSAQPNARTDLLDLLLRAGELECALADEVSPDGAIAATITDRIAQSVVAGTDLRSNELAALLKKTRAAEKVSVAPPEGFAYYALHPLDMADLVETAEVKNPFAAVIGIRSIGTTLSAVVQAKLQTNGTKAERITVRPTGHPYDRATSFSPEQTRWIAAMLSHGAAFLVVDEGPGMSGSSFLSVGEALLAGGVPRSAISFLGTRCADPQSLTAPNAKERWSVFRARFIQPTRHIPKDATEYVAGGIWRAKAFKSEEEWPASWLQMERLKFLSQDGGRLFRFEGFGRFGEDVHRRAVRVAEAGFGPMPLPREEGFGVYPILPGRYLSASDANGKVLTRIAQYCAFRAEAVRAGVEDTPELETMYRFNWKQEFGADVPEQLAQLRIQRPVIADARMLPHKWIETADRILKLDSASHGDDHFFPGPTDIAWDLAGTIVEWDLSPAHTNFFVWTYASIGGDDPSDRLQPYLLAYTIFRCSYCKMAAAASSGHPEYTRLVREYERYRIKAETLLHFATLTPKGQAA